MTAINTPIRTEVPQEIPFNRTPRNWKKIGVIIAFSIIPVGLLVLFTYYPFIEMVKYSFYNMKYIGTPKWVGLNNYIAVFHRDDTLAALKLSLYYAAGSILQVLLALYLATVLSFKVVAGNFFKGALFFPYLINGIAVGFIFKFFFTRGYIFDSVLQWFGFNLNNLPYWLRDQAINNWSLVGTSLWRYLGQTVVLFIGAIMSIDSSLYEAAEIDGANKFQQFIHIILPSIKTILVLNVLLSITGSLSAFEAPFVITGGANGTATYFVLMDTIAHTNQKVGLASAMAIVLLGLILIAALIQKIIFKYAFRNAGDGVEDATKKLKKQRKMQRQRNRVNARSANLFRNGKRVHMAGATEKVVK